MVWGLGEILVGLFGWLIVDGVLCIFLSDWGFVMGVLYCLVGGVGNWFGFLLGCGRLGEVLVMGGIMLIFGDWIFEFGGDIGDFGKFLWNWDMVCFGIFELICCGMKLGGGVGIWDVCIEFFDVFEKDDGFVEWCLFLFYLKNEV